MTKKGIIKMLICIAVLFLSLSMFFQSWFSIKEKTLNENIQSGYESGKNAISILLEKYIGMDLSVLPDVLKENVLVQTILDLSDNASKQLKEKMTYSPHELTRAVKNASDITSIVGDSLEAVPLIGVKLKNDSANLRNSALLLEIWQYAVYVAAGIAFASIIYDRTVGILPYTFLLCGYPWFVLKKIMKDIPIIGSIRLFGLTPFAIMSLFFGISLLLMSIFIRDKKRDAVRRETRRIIQRGY